MFKRTDDSFCTRCNAPEVHPDGDKVLVRGYKIDDLSQCLVCSGYYDENLNETPENHNPDAGWFGEGSPFDEMRKVLFSAIVKNANRS